MSVGGLFAMIFRTELALPVAIPERGDEASDQNGLQFYNTLMSLHGMIMIVSILLGVAGMINYLVPLLIGAQDMAFPRLNAFAFWVAVPAAVLAAIWRSSWAVSILAGRLPPLSARAGGHADVLPGRVGWPAGRPFWARLNVIATVVRCAPRA
jgi:cytochrome c oxidase subunit I